MSTTTENITGLGIRTITRCDRCNFANGWGVVTHRVRNPITEVDSDYCTHCLIVMNALECMESDCIVCVERL